jgi:hypothetical protein
MNMAGFTAEVSLCRSSGHYRTGRLALNISAQMIYPARDEVIIVRGCAPGSDLVEYGDGTWGCEAPDPWPGSGGGSGVPAPGGGAGPGPGGGGGPGPVQPPDRPQPQGEKPPIRKPYHPREGDPCHAENILMQGSNVLDWSTAVRTGEYKYNPDPARKKKYNCVDPKTDKIEWCLNNSGPIEYSDGTRRWLLCFDDHR